MILCTLFNSLYLPQGLALYRSLEATTAGKFILYILCMDDFTAAAITALRLPQARVIRISEMEDEALKIVKTNRTVGEYCWTCTAPLLIHIQDRHPPGTVVTYIDADIRFFSNPSAILNELGDRSIFIHEHDFAPEHAHLLPAAGRFNVGVIAFRNDSEGRGCLQYWMQQCLDECIMDPAAGKCGDQKYLDDWPSRYRQLVISKNPGIGLAPWNITKHRLEGRRRRASVDGSPIVFYHYHSLRMLRPRCGFNPTAMVAGNYAIEPEVIDTIYRPYVRELWSSLARLRCLGYSTEKAFTTLPAVYETLETRQVMFSIGGISLSVGHNAWALNVLYGIDVHDSR